MSKMIFGYGSTLIARGETLAPDEKTMIYYIVFKDTGEEHPVGPAEDATEDFIEVDHSRDVVFFFPTRGQRDRVADSFNPPAQHNPE